MSYQAPGGYNTYPNTFEASGNLVVNFSRNPASFPLIDYSEIRPVQKKSGYYVRWSPDSMQRSLDEQNRDSLWLDGADRPSPAGNQGLFESQLYRTKRYNKGTIVGQQAVEQADFMVEAMLNAMVIEQTLISRTRLALYVLRTTSWGTNTAAVDNGLETTGHNWSTGTTSNPYFRDSLLQAMSFVNLSMGGTFQPSNFVLVMNPNTARKTAVSAEINQIYIQSQFANDAITGAPKLLNGWGMPREVAGVRIVIENTTYNSKAIGTNSPTNAYVLPDGQAYLLLRPGKAVKNVDADGNALPDEAETPLISTLCGFFKEEMTVEVFDEPKHRRLEIDVADEFQYLVSSPLSGFYFTACNG